MIARILALLGTVVVAILAVALFFALAPAMFELDESRKEAAMNATYAVPEGPARVAAGGWVLLKVAGGFGSVVALGGVLYTWVKNRS
jgi:uncharacterized protein YcnI